jgi:sterol desaturase/sphingolipid hydroxylase (fatty acid hydroxylase superfamily)
MIEGFAWGVISLVVGVWLIIFLPATEADAKVLAELERAKHLKRQEAMEAERQRPRSWKDWVTVAWLTTLIVAVVGGAIAAGAYGFAFIIAVSSTLICLKAVADQRRKTIAGAPKSHRL